MNYINFRTDMADERVDIYKKIYKLDEVDGINVKKEEENSLKITTVDIYNENGSKVLSKEIGKYITIETNEIEYLTEEEKQFIILKLCDQIKLLINDSKSFMIVGLGNTYVTPDALGPKVVKNLDVTRHILKYAKEYADNDMKELSAISPGVLGTTGIETFEIIESVVSKVKPSIIIAIDSLASQSIDRIGRSIQLSNTGITPGAGIKNKREGLNNKTLNVPVIAIGVPTVVDMATITNDAIDKIINANSNEFFKLTDIDYNKIAETLDTENYIVTPKQIDVVIDKMSEIIASSINMI